MILCILNVSIGLFMGTLKVQGRIITESDHYYIADFSEDYRKKLPESTDDVSRVLVDKVNCIKE